MSKATIVVIGLEEDNWKWRELVVWYFSRFSEPDYEVFVVDTPSAGLRLLEERQPEAAIIRNNGVMGSRNIHIDKANQPIWEYCVNHHIGMLWLAPNDRQDFMGMSIWERANADHMEVPFDIEEMKLRLNNLIHIANLERKHRDENQSSD